MPPELDQYGKVMEQVAKEKGYFFVSNRYLFGKDYNEAKKNGWMEEEFHPNDKGNAKIVKNLLTKAGDYIEKAIENR